MGVSSFLRTRRASENRLFVRICVANYPGLWYRFRGRLGNGDRSEPTAGVGSASPRPPRRSPPRASGGWPRALHHEQGCRCGSAPTQVKLSSHSARGRDRQGFQTDLPPPSTHKYARRLILMGQFLMGQLCAPKVGQFLVSINSPARRAEIFQSPQYAYPFSRTPSANS